MAFTATASPTFIVAWGYACGIVAPPIIEYVLWQVICVYCVARENEPTDVVREVGVSHDSMSAMGHDFNQREGKYFRRRTMVPPNVQQQARVIADHTNSPDLGE